MEPITLFTTIISFSLLSFTTSAWDYSSIFSPSHSTPHFSPNYVPTPAPSPSPSPSPSPNPNHEFQTYKIFILTSCNSSTYPSICYQSLSPFASKIQSDPFKLCNISLSLALKSAVKTTSLISDIIGEGNFTATETATAVMRDCLDNVKDSVGELKESLEEMAHLEDLKDDVDRAFHVSTIQTAVSAAITDDSTCSDGFDEENVDGGVREKIRKSVVNVQRMTSNALYFINNLVAYY